MIEFADYETGNTEIENVLLEQLLESRYFMDVAELPEVGSN